MAYDSESDRVILFGGDAGQGVFLPSNETWAYDSNGNTWTRMSPDIAPTGRLKHAMAYDVQSDRIVMFGGDSAGGFGGELNDTWAYDYNTDTWTQMNPTVSPSARDNHGMAYDSESDRIVLLGGLPEGGGETWIYDFVGNTWTKMEPSAYPNWANVDTMAYDSESDRVIAFSGWPVGSTGPSDETWTYDLNSNVWSAMSPAARPEARASHSMTYDSESDRVILFGDRIGSQASNSTWAYHANRDRWESLAFERSPSARSLHALAYDEESRNVVLYGGLPRGEGKNGETWIYRHPLPPPRPPPRDIHAMAYDVESDRMVVFGGDVGQVVLGNDTWAYDFNANRWAEMSPEASPSPRWFHAMAYDSESDRTILFGGYTDDVSSQAETDETWSYDLETNTWTDQNPVVRPPAGGRSPMVYDSESDRIVLFIPGSDAQIWVYDFDTNLWANMTGGIERPTIHGDMVYDAESDRIVLFGACDGVLSCPSMVTWAYDLNTDTWTNLTSGTAPSTRSGHRMAYDAESDRVILFGGQAYVVRHNDTWAYDLNTNTWTEMHPPTAPRARDIHTMDYDAESDRVILFGGQMDGPVRHPTSDETWAYDYNTDTWVEMSRPRAPRWSPTRFKALAGDAEVSLEWSTVPDDGRSPITGYRIYRNTTAASLDLLVELENFLTYVDTEVEVNVSHFYAVTAVNALGESPLSQIVTARPMDLSPPSVMIHSPQEGATLPLSPFVVEGGATDNVAVARVECRVNEDAWLAAVGTSSWSLDLALAAGNYTITCQAVDTSGNSAVAAVTILVEDEATEGDGVPFLERIPGGIWTLGALVLGTSVLVLFLWRRRGSQA